MRCKNCKKKISEFAKECPYCHTKSTDSEKQVVRYLEKVEHDRARLSSRNKKDSKKQRKRAYIIGIMVFAAIMVGGKAYQKQHNEWPLDENRITYLTGDTLITQNLETNAKIKLTTFEQADFYDGYKTDISSTEQAVYHESPEKKCIFFTSRVRHYYEDLNGRIMLYKKDTTNINSKPELIEESIQTLVYDKEGNVYYIPATEDSIVKYDGTLKETLDFPNAMALKYNEKQNKIFVSTYDMGEDSHNELSVISLPDFSVHKIGEFMDWNVIYSEDGESVYYQNKNVLYRYDCVSGNTKQIANNVSSYQAEGKKLYYIQYELQKHSYYDFVKDPYLQEDQAAKGKEDKNCLNRNEKREQLKKTPLYTAETILFCYEDGEYQEVERNMGYLYNWGNYVEQSSSGITVCRQMEVEVKYALAEFGTEQIDDIKEFYMDSNSYGNENVEVGFCEWYDTSQINGENLPCVVIMGTAAEQEGIQNGKTLPEVSELLKEIYTRSANGITCYYDSKNESLVRVGTNNQEEEVASDIFSFCMLKDGTILVMAGEGEDTSYDLYEIGQTGTKRKIAESVWGIFGENICQVRDYNQIEERG